MAGSRLSLDGEMGWERPGPDSILPRGGARPTPAAIHLCFCLLCAQALHKVFDLTRGDGRRWSLRQDRRPGSLAPVKRQPTSTSINPPHFAHALLHPLPAFRSVSSEIQPARYPNPLPRPSARPTNCPQHNRMHMQVESHDAATCSSSLTHSLIHSSPVRCMRTVLAYLCIIVPPSNLHSNPRMCTSPQQQCHPRNQNSSVGRRIRTKSATTSASTPLPDRLPLDRPPRLAPLLQLLGPLTAAALLG